MAEQKKVLVDCVSDEDILETIDNPATLLKPKTKQPSHKKVLSDAERQRRSEHLKAVNANRIQKSLVKQEEKVVKQEEQIKTQLKEVEEKKKSIQAKKKPDPAKLPSVTVQKPVDEPMETKKEKARKPKEAYGKSKSKSKPVKVVIEQSSSDSEDYGTSSSSDSEDEVIYIAKTNRKKKQEPLTKAKAHPVPPQAPPVEEPKVLFKFI
jgi:hypothetical protein